MKLKVKFSELEQTFKANFGEALHASDGDYEKGFIDGKSIGYTQGNAEGYLDGHQKGYEEGKTDGYKNGYNDGHTEGVSEGKQAERDFFWETYQEGGNRDDIYFAFYGDHWNDTIYNPKYPFTNIQNANQGFRFSYITDTKHPITFAERTWDNQRINCLFGDCHSLKTIRTLTVNETLIYYNMFFNSSALENITFEGVIANDISFSNSKKLTLESAISVITHLKDFSGTNDAFTRTVTFTSETLAKLAADGTNSPNGTTWLEYIAELGWNAS